MQKKKKFFLAFNPSIGEKIPRKKSMRSIADGET
jgi:hypothetical protein